MTASPMAATLASAFRAHQAGHRSDAERLYRDLLAVEPRNAGALHLLGALLHQTGRSDEAISLMRQAIAIEPANPDYHYNLGSVLNASGHTADAVEPLTKAIALNPRYAEAHFELGIVYSRIGQLDDAEKTLRRALQLQPSNATLMTNLGRVLVALSRRDEAIALWQRAVTLQPDLAIAHLNLGLAAQEQNRLDDAEQSLRRTLAIQPDQPVAARQLAAVLLSLGRADEAFAFAERALAAQETPVSRALYVRCLMWTSQFNPTAGVRENLRRALAEAWVDPTELAPLCASIIKAHPIIGPAVGRVSGEWSQAAAGQQHPMISEAEIAAADEPLLRAFLEATPTCDVEIERFLTALRANLLERCVSGQEATAGMLNLCSSLARQCFVTEYVFNEYPSETSRVGQLTAAVLSSIRTAAPLSPFQLASFAMYRPLHSLEHAEQLLGRDWPVPVGEILRQQVREPIEEIALRDSTPRLTAIDDASALARDSYEQRPYPRWTNAPAATPLPITDIVRQRLAIELDPATVPPSPADILIAGCQTGLGAVIAARSYQDARILAIDPSLADLAYARRQAARLGLGNLEFAQADIPGLGTLDRRFDLIEAGDALHRLDNPEAGWRILTSLLRPGGLMRIALFSDIARRAMDAAREFAAAGNYQPDLEGIRLCRQAILRMPADANARDVVRSVGFYSTGAFRDMVMDRREHRMSLSDIQTVLSGNGLRLLGFETGDALRRAFSGRFPDPAARTDLAAWHQFESEQPEAFGLGYVFWVQKPA